VVGNAKNIEMQLNQAGKDLAKAEQLVMAGITAADKKRVDGDTAGADAMDQATARQAATVTSLRTRVEDLKQSYQQAYDAAELAKQQDKDAEAMLQQAIQRRAELEGKAAQAKLLEATNTAMAQLHDTSGHIIPTMGEIEAKINTQYANAVGVQELDAANGMHDEQLITAANAELGAADVVAEMRAKMGQPAPAIEGTPAPEALPAAPAS
jgi:phage shock protein A